MRVTSGFKGIFWAALIFLHLFASANASDDTRVWKANVEGWTVSVDKTLGNGCFMWTQFEGDTFIRAQFNPTADNFLFMAGNPAWKSLNLEKFYDLTVQFGNRDPWEGEASVVILDNVKFLVIKVSGDDSIGNFTNELMRMTGVKISYQGEQIANLSLDGSYRAMEEVFACQAAVNSDDEKSDDPFSNESDPNDPFS